jgi:two-component system sensor histidine kinase HydH
MQRFTNLDRADVQFVQINDLLADVIALIEPESRDRACIEFRPGAMLPRITGRPQQLSAVLSNLIVNAVDATTGGGRVLVESSASPSHIEITVQDYGRGMTAEELSSAFNPATFRVSGLRMAAGNWSLFSSRQIVQEHGGDVEIESAPNQGTTVRITLPL